MSDIEPSLERQIRSYLINRELGLFLVCRLSQINLGEDQFPYWSTYPYSWTPPQSDKSDLHQFSGTKRPRYHRQARYMSNNRVKEPTGIIAVIYDPWWHHRGPFPVIFIDPHTTAILRMVSVGDNPLLPMWRGILDCRFPLLQTPKVPLPQRESIFPCQVRDQRRLCE